MPPVLTIEHRTKAAKICPQTASHHVLSPRQTKTTVPANQASVNLEREVVVGRRAAKVQALLGTNNNEMGIWKSELRGEEWGI